MKILKYIKFGTCSWKYSSWKGIIYPVKGNFNFLREYSKHFNSVEIDQWFWSLFGEKIRLPSQKDVKEYNNSVPEDFKFTIKAPNSITLTHHYKKLKNEELKPNPFFLSIELYNEFLESIKELHSKIGMIMLQFEYLNKQKMSSQIEFLTKLKAFLKAIPKSINIGLELRNPNYLNEIYFEFINEMDVANVFLQGYYMPPIWDLYSRFRDKINKKVIIRLHGPNREEIETASEGNWDKIIFPKDEELMKIVEVLKDLESRKINTYVNVNNHYEGCAPLTIKRIQNLLLDA